MIIKHSNGDINQSIYQHIATRDLIMAGFKTYISSVCEKPTTGSFRIWGQAQGTVVSDRQEGSQEGKQGLQMKCNG